MNKKILFFFPEKKKNLEEIFLTIIKMIPFNFIYMNQQCTLRPAQTLLRIGYHFGFPLYYKGLPIIHDVKTTPSLYPIFYTGILFKNLIPSFKLLLYTDATETSIQSLVVHSKIIRHLHQNDLYNLSFPYYKFHSRENWKPILIQNSLYLPKNQETIQFHNIHAKQSYLHLLKECHQHQILLKIKKGDVLILDNNSVLLSNDPNQCKCLYLQ